MNTYRMPFARLLLAVATGLGAGSEAVSQDPVLPVINGSSKTIEVHWFKTWGSQHDPFCSCAEEHLLGYPGDPYEAERILIHELAHNVHLRGMNNVDPTFESRLEAADHKAMAAGLWKAVYASVNHHEYFTTTPRRLLASHGQSG